MTDGPHPLSCEEFLQGRTELPDSGQWAELDAGRVLLLQPPDLEHGNCILNLSKAVARWVGSPEAGTTYACFALGLIVQQDPDTVRFPAVSFFDDGPRFAEADKEATTTRPAVVIEVASSSDRRAALPQRIADYLQWGGREVWVIDPFAATVRKFSPSQAVVELSEAEELHGGHVLPGFRIDVTELFVEPDWWMGRSRGNGHAKH